MADYMIRPVAMAQTRELRQRVLRPHQTLTELAAQEPDSAYAVGAFTDDGLIGAGFICPDGGPGVWRMRGMATEPHARGRGVGSAIIAALVEYVTAQDATRVWLNARTPALSLYLRAGFLATSEPFELPDIGPHVSMELVIDPQAVSSAGRAGHPR